MRPHDLTRKFLLSHLMLTHRCEPNQLIYAFSSVIALRIQRSPSIESIAEIIFKADG